MLVFFTYNKDMWDMYTADPDAPKSFLVSGPVNSNTEHFEELALTSCLTSTTLNDADYDQENVIFNAQKNVLAAYCGHVTEASYKEVHFGNKDTKKCRKNGNTEAKEADKAMNYKRKDFGSAYNEAFKKNQAFSETKFKKSKG
ncbi:hypothetical protein GN958_ATG20138 [Phytophthora infestans]|uniref:Uncharacterized protein n=1 Tax=Phytophthora infestans TaxID=4787 RepID=A0A8S9TVS8_PHYIN|nr:hypothetical protein GN958_ATG20138 [Phytophthora infestans]